MTHASPPAPRPRFSEQFAPKLLTVLREGYGAGALRSDAIAGLTVAIVALPLSMAIAIASGVGPERGLYTAIIGGFLVSALGGSRFQIGGPAGAFIVLVAACVQSLGVPGLLTATLLSGAMLFASVFLINDPVTLPKNELSRLVYGILLGVATMMFRYFGNYETGVCFALLAVNSLSGYIDRVVTRLTAHKKGVLRREI